MPRARAVHSENYCHDFAWDSPMFRTGDYCLPDSHQMYPFWKNLNMPQGCFINKQVANYNHDQLNKLQHPVACISACHSSSFAKNASWDDMSGLEPVAFLAKTAKLCQLWIYGHMLVSTMEPQGQYVILSTTKVIAHQTCLLLLLFNLITIEVLFS